MTHFTPGAFIKTFRARTGEEIILRTPMWEDLDELIRYINKISREDTYVTFSGESITRDEEINYLTSCFRSMEQGHSVMIYAICGAHIIGTCSVERVFTHRKRAYHVGSFGISLEQEYRGKGIGYAMSQAVIYEGKAKIPGLELLTLEVYSENTKAIAMYEKLGFKKCGDVPNGLKYKDRYIDNIKMYRDLR